MKALKLPKNFRQIGEPLGSTKIYMEDYVMTYLRAITKDSNTYVRGAILFGNMEKEGGNTYVFVNGAMEAQNIELDLDETVFDDEVWKKIYETREHYFPRRQVIGWYLCRVGMSVRLNDKVKRTHFENFPGDGKILYVRDPLEEEEAMYAYRGQDLIRQNGYYVYYVKNREMQEYLIMQREEQEAALSYERMVAQRRDEQLLHQTRRKLKKKKEKKEMRHSFRKTVEAAMLMFVIGLLGTYLMLGNDAFANRTTLAISHALQNIKISKKEDAGDLTAIFTEQENTPTETKDTKKETISQKKVYVVQEGDTIIKISMALFHSKDYVDAIMQENDLQKGEEIYPGQELKIPSVK